MEAGALGGELHEHRHRPVRLRRGPREESVGHFALHHHAPAVDLLDVQALGDERRRDVVGQVRDELVGRRLEARDVEPHRIAPVHRRARDALEARGQAPVDLDGVHVRDPLGEIAREDAEPGPDLEHDVARRELRQALDHAEDVVVDEEVLAERFARGDTHSPKTASALRTIWSRIASPCNSARTS